MGRRRNGGRAIGVRNNFSACLCAFVAAPHPFAVTRIAASRHTPTCRGGNTTLKVLLTLVTSSSGLSGVQRHALNLAACLLVQPEIEVELVVAPWQRDLAFGYGIDHPRLRVRVANVPASALGRNAWFYSTLPRLAHEIGADVVHASYPIPVKSGGFRVPLVVALHDLYPFDVPVYLGRFKATLHRFTLRQCLAHAYAITCVSQTTAH